MNYYVKGTIRQEIYLDVEANSQKEAEEIAREIPSSLWHFGTMHPVGLVDVRGAELDE